MKQKQQKLPRINKQKMWYALYAAEETIYERDENGNIVYIDVDGELVPVEAGTAPAHFEEPVSFMANISMSGGEAQAVEFGIDVSQYSAVVVTGRGELPLEETSRIWFETNPLMNNDGTVDGNSADYKIVKISPSLSYTRYLLQRIVK